MLDIRKTELNFFKVLSLEYFFQNFWLVEQQLGRPQFD